MLRRGLLGPGRRNRWRRQVARRALAVVAFALALLTARAAVLPPPEPVEHVHVAARDLPAGHLLAPGDLTTAPVPARMAVAAHLLTGAEVAGRQLATGLRAGELLTDSRLVPRSVAEGLPRGTSPFHVRVTDPRMLDLVAAGRRVRIHRASTGEMLAASALVLVVDPPEATTGSLLPAGGDRERGLVLALPEEVVDAALSVPEDGTLPRVHVVPVGG